MAKTSLFKFTGELHPKDKIPLSNASYTLQRSGGSTNVSIIGSTITVEFIANFDSFDDLYDDTIEFIQAFLAVQSLRTWFPLQVIFTEWVETPLEPIGSDGISHVVKGRILREEPEKTAMPPDALTFPLADGISWSEDLEVNPFLRRAVIDFNYALQQPLNNIPIYLYRAIESAEAHFGGENKLIQALNVGKQTKMVKRLANEGDSGLHVRHASRTANTRKLTREDITNAVEATNEILSAFQREVWSKRIQSQ